MFNASGPSIELCENTLEGLLLKTKGRCAVFF